MIAVVAVVAVAAVSVLALLLTGVIPSPLARTPSSNIGPDLSYAQVRPAADRTAHAYSGGPWTFEAAAGFSLHAHWADWASNTTGSSCSGPAQTVYYPAEQGSVSVGLGALWVFVYTNYVGEALEVAVTNGTTSLAITVSTSASGCGWPSYFSAINGSAIDSTAAAQVVDASGGSTFMSQHPQASASYELVNLRTMAGGYAYRGEVWMVSYSNCIFGGSYGSYPGGAFYATVNATTGALIQAQNQTYACGGTTVAAITMTATSGGTCANTGTGGLTYNTFSIMIGGTTQTVTTANFGIALTQAGMSVATPTGANSAAATTTCPVGNGGLVPAAAGNWEAVLLAPGGGSVLAVYGGSFSAWTTATGAALGSPVTIVGGQTLLVTAGSSVNLVQADISVYGTNGASVTGSVTI